MCEASKNFSPSSIARLNRAVRQVQIEPLEPRRLMASGAIDPTFAGGMITQDFLQKNDFALAVAVQADNKVVVAGWIVSPNSAGNDIAVARFNVDGSLDQTFGGSGMVVTDLGSSVDSAFAVKVQADGKIVVAGQTKGVSTSTDLALVRYNADGSMDTSFGAGGIVKTDLNHGSSDHTTAMTLTTGGNIVVVGWTMVSGSPQFAAARYTPGGLLDSSFGTGGIVMTPFASGSAQATSVAGLADGSVVVAGTLTDFNSFGSDFVAVHYLASGALDTSFGSNGWAKVDLGGDTETANGVAIAPDGAIILAGQSLKTGPVNRIWASLV